MSSRNGSRHLNTPIWARTIFIYEVLSPEDDVCSGFLLRASKHLFGDLVSRFRTVFSGDDACLLGKLGDTDAGDEYELDEEVELA